MWLVTACPSLEHFTRLGFMGDFSEGGTRLLFTRRKVGETTNGYCLATTENIQRQGGRVAEWLARRTRDLGVAGSSHLSIALGKQLTLTFLTPSTCKMGTQLQAILEPSTATSCTWVKKWLPEVLVCWDIRGGALWRHSYAE
ncbi:hypothetical protein ElyMa_001595500 [Elysia marginata]|uniref:Uncharacterized protein n=1 Tax=Elysia marginata TaxID=1093978 RepID=A0AAV4JGT8_9GAST|nr:hypothetical protein ElyMa_001595500 [Elysia marginata]